jgi:hypothetical protein
MTDQPPPKSPRLIDDEQVFCEGCGYNLTGQLAAGIRRCSECGRTCVPPRRGFDPDEADIEARGYMPDFPREPEPVDWWGDPRLIAWMLAPGLLMALLTAGGSTPLLFLRGFLCLLWPFALYAWAAYVVHPRHAGWANSEAFGLMFGLIGINLFVGWLLGSLLGPALR